ncbi:MAG TPA: hypothetical protein VJ085_07660, partial [Candidatus Acidoferrales bacterium]|nr:hypothetical protein [Candidatus Acidoferrales bacterium]
MKRGSRRRLCASALAVALLAATLAPPAPAWEGKAHRLIILRAVETLPYPLRAYFETQRFTLADLCEKPSQWGEEEPRPEHGFIHLDHYGRYPFPEL